MIKKFQKFNLSLHEHNDVDPFNEENWEDIELIDITLKTPLKIGDIIYDFENDYYGVIIDIMNDGYEYMVDKGYKRQWVSKLGFTMFGYKLKIK